jgi:hypothetical protein
MSAVRADGYAAVHVLGAASGNLVSAFGNRSAVPFAAVIAGCAPVSVSWRTRDPAGYAACCKYAISRVRSRTEDRRDTHARWVTKFGDTSNSSARIVVTQLVASTPAAPPA